ncbi:MAG: translocation/assembly module TamB domain-containing protein [Calothrix sp. C42_A2020_038]|nr:translocation/assembly module TamB domain-containing protein [Calothrix sp. C42_A2020_038]
MRQLPPGRESETSNRRLWLLLLRRGSIVLVLLLLASVVGGAWWLRNFIYRDLVPLVQTNLENLLGRPIEVGNVERITFNSIRFSSLNIPATSTDPDNVVAKAVDVQFSPLQVLLTRTLNLNVTLLEPNAYLEQDQNGQWISTQLPTEPEEVGLIRTNLESLRIRNASLTLVPTPKPSTLKTSIGFNQAEGIIRILPDQGFSYEVGAFKSNNQGQININGKTQLVSGQVGSTNLNLQASNLAVTNISKLVQLPITVQAGSVNANLAVNITPQAPISLTGTANLNQIAAKVDNIPQAITNTQGNLQFQGQEVTINNLTTNIGKIPLQVNGTLNTQTGYNLNAQVKPIDFQSILSTFNFQPPVTAVGQVQANVKVQGSIQQPTAIGTISTVKVAQVDRFQFKSVSSNFRVDTSGTTPLLSVSNLQVIPTLGGQVTGNGNIQLTQQGQVNLNIQASGIPGNPVAQAYDIALPLNVGNVAANANVSGRLGTEALQLALQNLNVTPQIGGQVTGNGNIQLAQQGQVNLNIQASGIPGNPVAQAYDIALPLNVGNVAANANVSGRLGTEALQLALQNLNVTPQIGGQVTGNGNIQLAQQGQVNLNIQASGIPGNPVAQAYDIALPLNVGNVAANANVSGRLGTEALQLALQNLNVTPQIGGQVTGNGNIQLAQQGQVNLNIQASQIPGDAVARAYQVNTPITIGNVSANANISGALNNFKTVAQFEAPRATYPSSGQVVIAGSDINNIELQNANFRVAGGTVTARGKLEDNRFNAFINASGVELNRLKQLQLPQQLLQGSLNTALQISGTSDSLQLENLQILGVATVNNIAGGAANLSNISLNNGLWQVSGGTSQVALNQFSPNLQGRLNSSFNIAGTTASFALADIRGGGQFNISQAPFVNQPLTAQAIWDGQQVILQRATTPGLNVNGAITVNTQTATPEITNLNLNVAARNFNLQRVPVTLPNLTVAGRVDFAGQVTGTLTAPVADGNIELRNFVVNNLAFDPVLAGNVTYQGLTGAALNLTGNIQDRIAINLGADNFPTSFLIQRGESIASGKTEGDNLIATAQNFPVAVLTSLVPTENVNIQPLAGNISGNIIANLKTREASGDVAVVQPRIGRIAGEIFQGQFSFIDGIANLTNGQFQIGNSLVSLNGSVETGGNRQVQVQANVSQARIENLLQALSIFEFEDLFTGVQSPQLAGAEVLQTTPISLPQDISLLAQLQEFNRIVENIASQQTEQQQEIAGLPALSELKGLISANLNVMGSLESGLNANFNINGLSWEWGSYNIGEVTANGGFADGVLTLQPLRVGLNGGLLAFTGQLGQQEFSGELQVSELPISILQPLLARFPVDVTGNINALTMLSGSLTNPSVTGEASLVNARLNERPIQSAQLSFDLNNARLNFESTVAVTDTQPLNVKGSIPAALPFGAEPDSNQINIIASIQNEGLSLLNALTDQVSWVNGEGVVNVAIGGTLSQPTITGTANINNATLEAQALTKPLTNVTGTVQFDRNIVEVQNFWGTYNGGAVTAVGSLSIFEPQTVDNPLTVSLNNLNVNLQELYQGGVNGNAVITGSVQRPILGGAISLANGEVSLPTQPQPTQQTQQLSFNQPTETTTISRPPIGFSGLQLILEDNVRVTSQPLIGFGNELSLFEAERLLSFNAQGALKINGTLQEPRPQGVINLTGGRINLFTTQFVLERGYDHTATFTPNLGFDPILDVRLLAIVPESNTGYRLPTSPISSEITDIPITTLGTLRSVRVFARVNGQASQLEDNLELTSDPRRSRTEIVSLIGGSFINALSQPDAGLGIISLAGDTIFTPIQGLISSLGQSIGLSELRLYPTVINNRSANRSSSVLGLAAEAGFNVNRNISLSVSRVFIIDEPFRYNLLYRINDEILLRGSTDLFDDSRALLEYETRF